MGSSRKLFILTFIVKSGSYPLITFTLKLIKGLLDEIAVCDLFTLEEAGDLKMVDLTHHVTFTLSVTVDPEMQIQGVA
jgi:hypothetical protein